MGGAADIAVFDPGTLKENTTYANPHQLSSGLRHLLVNGVHSLEDGKHTDQRGRLFLG